MIEFFMDSSPCWMFRARFAKTAGRRDPRPGPAHEAPAVEPFDVVLSSTRLWMRLANGSGHTLVAVAPRHNLWAEIKSAAQEWLIADFRGNHGKPQQRQL
jgi:hypothetical protein